MQIKKKLLKIVPYPVFRVFRDLFYPEKINVLEDRLNSFFTTYYQGLAAPALSQKEQLKNAEFKVYSKHGADGLLLYIFSKIGATNHTFVEMGIETGRECNTANLALNFGWRGLLLEANKEWTESAKKYYRSRLGNNADNVRIAECFVTAENINSVLQQNNIQSEIDLLSIDIDSNDYWVWKAIDIVNPRVVVVEYNAAMGLEPVTIKYNPNFHYQKMHHKNPLYFGASLPAFSKLGNSKGYMLVGCDIRGHDAYFVRNDVAKGIFTELSAEEAFYPNPVTLTKFGSVERQFDMIKHLDLEKV